MLDEHDHLFLRDETFEPAKCLSRLRWIDPGLVAVPDDPGGDWKQIPHERCLTGKLELDGTISKAGSLALSYILLVSVNGADGIIHGLKFDVRILRLAGDPLHNNVHWLVSIVENARVTAQESNDLRTPSAERYLKNSLVCVMSRSKDADSKHSRS